MRSQLHIVLSVLALSVAACSNGGGGGGGGGGATPPVVVNPTSPTPQVPGATSEFTYEYHQNGCTTGKQRLTSKAAYCDALLNDALNNNCAREMRVETFNRMCANGTTVSPTGGLQGMSTARCEVNGMDLRDRSIIQNMNPFNPQRRQIYRDMFWNAKSENSYEILGSLIDTYGRARFVMTPAQAQTAAQGEIDLSQQKGEYRFSVRSALGYPIQLKVTNEETEKEVSATCISHSSFKRAKADLSRIRCSFANNEVGRRSTERAEEIVWDVKNTVEKEVFRGRSSERILLRLKPAQGGQEERIQVVAQDLDVDKTMQAETSLTGGLEVRFRAKLAGREVTLSCAPASK
nr:hypothetical protein BdHM001_01790 [Bdellovibrio sp. HM001]